MELSAVAATSAEYSDNIGRTPANTNEDIVHRLGLDLGVNERRAHFETDVNFTLEHEHYYNHTFADETSLTTGFGLFNIDLIESFLNWNTSFTRTEVLSDTAATDTPDNREHRDVFRSGPLVSYQPSRTSRFDLAANYISVENSDENVSDSERADGRFSYFHAFNSVTDFTINSTYGETIDPDEGNDYTNININAGFVRRFTNGELQFNAGRTALKPRGSASTRGNFFDISLSREQVFSHDIAIQYHEDISDTSIGFITDEQGSENDDVSLRSTTGNDTVKRKRVSMSVSRVMGDISYSANAFWQQQRFIVQQSDENSQGLVIAGNQQISPGLSAGFEYTYRLHDFVDRPSIGKDKTNGYRLSSQYELSRSFSANGFINFSARSNSKHDSREYEALTLGLGLNWVLY